MVVIGRVWIIFNLPFWMAHSISTGIYWYNMRVAVRTRCKNYNDIIIYLHCKSPRSVLLTYSTPKSRRYEQSGYCLQDAHSLDRIHTTLTLRLLLESTGCSKGLSSFTFTTPSLLPAPTRYRKGEDGGDISHMSIRRVNCYHNKESILTNKLMLLSINVLID